MWPTRYWADRYWAPRYWAKAADGEEPPAEPALRKIISPTFASHLTLTT